MTPGRRSFGAAAIAAALIAGASAWPAAPAAGRLVHVPAGSYLPLYRQPPAAARGDSAASQRAPVARPVEVDAFELDVHPVTNGEYLEFVRDHPEWRRSRVKRLLADESYLRHWRGDLDPGPGAPERSPVVNVSWFAARAFCRARGMDLPTVAQWEYAAAVGPARRDAGRERGFQQRLQQWYARPTPTPLPAVGTTFRNAYGVEDLHGLVWEWTLDFNSSLVTGESRADQSLERSLYCGGAAAGATDFEDYAAFMRYAFRSSLEARYCVGNLGFRAARPSARVAAGRSR